MTWVLVADDDQAIRETIELVLKDAGHSVLQAADGAEALEMLRTSDQRMVVLLDQLMPRMDGINVLRAVAGDRKLAHAHGYVLVSGVSHVLSEDERVILTQAHAGVLPKPFDLDELLEVVDQTAQRLGPT
jgi:two-component system chemotaxis response regulator CheY